MRFLFAGAVVIAGWTMGSVAMADSPPPPQPLRPPDPQTVCYQLYRPVCGTTDGQRVTYSNDCYAKVAHATDVTDGACASGK